MINLSLIELAVATCFSSERLAQFYKDLLLNPAQLFSQGFIDRDIFHQQCQQILSQTLDSDYPRKFRLNELDAIFELIWPVGVFNHNQLPMLDHCFDKLMVNDNGFIHYRRIKVNNYAKLLARLDTTILVAWHLAKSVSNNQIEQPQLIKTISQLNPIFAPNSIKDEFYAENHTHLGGMHYDGMVLMASLLKQNSQILNKTINNRLRPLFGLTRLLLTHSDALDNSKTEGIEHKISNVLNNYWLIADNNDMDLSIYVDSHLAPNDPPFTTASSLVFVRKQLALAISQNKLTQAWVWLQVWLWHCYQQIDNFHIRISIVYLITELMAIRRQLIMDGRGLTRFVQYFNRPLRLKSADNQARMYDSVSKLFIAEQDRAEIKLTPEAITPEGIALFIEQIYKLQNQILPENKAWLDSTDDDFLKNQLNRWHICVHFLRRKEYQDKPQLVWKLAKVFYQKLIESKLWNHSKWQVEKHLLVRKKDQRIGDEILNPRHWIRGLDVAGDENLTSIEVFAPTIRWLRSKALSELDHGFHLSIHAGEDFNHPLTGMRNIDETIEFCDFKAGDRLGHGLAVGIKPQHWFELHGDVLIDIDEYFDNLVWVWGYCVDLNKDSELEQLIDIQQINLIIESKIKNIAKHVSWLQHGELYNSHIQDFYAAWKLRKNCFYQYQQSQFISLDKQTQISVLPSLGRITYGDIAAKIYLARWRYKTCTKALNLIEKNQVKPTQVYITFADDIDLADPSKPQQSVIQDNVTTAEISFYQLVQDIMLEKLREKDIIIEVNLTSNVYIANVEDYHLHPIFRWLPIDEDCLDNKFNVRTGANQVCVNTDDAGVMPTTLRTEYELLAKAAKKHSDDKDMIKQWLLNLKTDGITIFAKHHLNLHEKPDLKQILHELYAL